MLRVNLAKPGEFAPFWHPIHSTGDAAARGVRLEIPCQNGVVLHFITSEEANQLAVDLIRRAREADMEAEARADCDARVAA